MRISDWSSDVCSSDLQQRVEVPHLPRGADAVEVQAATTRQHGVGDGDLEEAAEIEPVQRRSAEHLVRPAIEFAVLDLLEKMPGDEASVVQVLDQKAASRTRRCGREIGRAHV